MFNGNRFRVSTPFFYCGVFIFADCRPVPADETIPAEMLSAILAPKKMPKFQWTFSPDQTSGVSPACNLTGVDLVKKTESEPDQTFPLLTDKANATASARTQILVKLNRIAVDADGSPRSYHPQDPTGHGICERTQHGAHVGFSGVCALDRIANAGVRIFRGVDEVLPYVEVDRTDPDGSLKKHRAANPLFASTWKDFWPLAATRKTISITPVPDRVVLYSNTQNVAALFRNKIIPFQNGFPCVQGKHDKAPGYFVSATADIATGKDPKGAKPPNLCDPRQYRDSTQIPYFVIPEGLFANIAVGDVAIGYAKAGDKTRIVYGIVGDIGPRSGLGEASIAFNQKLRDNLQPPMNSVDADKLDTNLSDEHSRANIDSMFVLLLGNTAKQLKQDYSFANIDYIARRALRAFHGEARLKACVNDLSER